MTYINTMSLLQIDQTIINIDIFFYVVSKYSDPQCVGGESLCIMRPK